jgi:hypothetical protein
MRTKYEKPFAKNLGDAIPNAQGDCFHGSTAVTHPGAECHTGLVARGGGCSYGGEPTNNQEGCHTGHTPLFYGCQDGYAATHPGCSTGDTPS